MILITGASGYVGRHLVARLISQGKRPRCLVRNIGLGWTIIQPSVLFGKDAPFIKGLADLIRSAPVVPLIGGGKTMFQPIYVEDVVTVIIKVLEDPDRTTGKTYTIGGPEYYSFTDVINALLHAMHKTRIKAYAPTPLVGVGAAVMEAVLPKPPLTKAAMTLFSFDNTTDLDSVERDFGFKPTSFTKYLEEQGV